MKKLFSIALSTLFALNMQAQVSITAGAGLTYTQNFNGLDTNAVGNTATPTGWAFYKSGTSATATNGQYKASNGATNSGDAYSIGAIGSTDRAFGGLASGGVRTTIGAIFTNNTGATITSVTFSGKAEQWRKGDNFMTPDTMYCAISTVATTIDSSLPGWNLVPGMNLLSSLTPADSLLPNGALDGNVAANFNTVNHLQTLNIPPGGTFAIRWYDANIQGSDDMLGLDDVTMTFATGTPPPPTAPIITSLVPADNSTNVVINTPITLNLSQNVTAGTGNIVIANLTDGTFQNIAVPSANVAIVGSTVSVTGASLLYNKSYSIAIDSNCFNNMGAKFAGIYNTTDWNFSTAAAAVIPVVNTLTPLDNATNVSTNSNLVINFSVPVTKGTTGIIDINNATDGTNLPIAITSSQVAVSGSTVTISGLSWLNGKDYFVEIDSTCFNAVGVNFAGFYAPTDWNFTILPPPPPVTSLNETFANCAFPLIGSFVQYSKVGAQNWRCTKFGHLDTNAAVVNGFSGGNLANEDYLISPPLNLSAMSKPNVHFWSKVRFGANTTKELLVSTNYTGGDPTLATWDPLATSFAGLDTTYKVYGSYNITPYKTNTMHIAFKYVSTTTDADEWSVDDINITDGVPTGLQSVSLNNTQLSVLGTAENGKLHMILNTENAANYHLQIIDMNGRALHNTQLNANAGVNNFNIDIPAISSGLYFVKITNGHSSAMVKFSKL